MNFTASGENISVVLETMLDCQNGATGEALRGFDVVRCVCLLSFFPTLLTEIRGISLEIFSRLPSAFSQTGPGFGDRR